MGPGDIDLLLFYSAVFISFALFFQHSIEKRSQHYLYFKKVGNETCAPVTHQYFFAKLLQRMRRKILKKLKTFEVIYHIRQYI